MNPCFLKRLRSVLAAGLVLLPSFSAVAADDRAAVLTAKAESLIDHWDGDAKALEEARVAIEESVQLDPGNPHARGVQARQVLLAGTSEEGIKPSALGKAHGILIRAALEMKPEDARVFAFLVPLRIALKQDDGFRYAKTAERAGPQDPWVQWAWAQYYAAQGDTAGQFQALEKAVALGLPSPIELRKAYDVLLPSYAGTRQREKLDEAYAGRVRLDPKDAYLRGNMARDLAVYFQDFTAAERFAREAIAMNDYAQARETLSLSLYGQWAQAARDGRGVDVREALYRKADAYDHGGHMLPGCLAAWKPLEFVYTRLEERSIRREDMHRC